MSSITGKQAGSSTPAIGGRGGIGEGLLSLVYNTSSIRSHVKLIIRLRRLIAFISWKEPII
jgi:hypothetical protein